MTRDEMQQMTPVVEALKARGIVTSYALTSLPDNGKILRDGYHGEEHSYTHGFLISAKGLDTRLNCWSPATEDQLIERIAAVLGGQNHHAAVTSTLTQAGETLLNDLAALYALRLRGKVVPIPAEVTLKDVRIPLS